MVKFFIVTMCSGETDTDRCIKTIESQRDVIVYHRTIHGMSEVDAHNTLYGMFNDFDPTYVRGKIDADMVLDHDHVLYEIGQKFLEAQKHNVQTLTVALKDFLSDSVLFGIPFYRSDIWFKPQTDRLRCDRNITIPACPSHVDINDPMGKHMFYCDERSAFRYGLHRGLKGQTNIYTRLQQAHAKLGDERRRCAIRGFDLGLTGVGLDAFDYSSAQFDELYKSHCKTC